MKDFYHDVFGWKFMDVLGMNYTVVHTVPTDDDGMLLEPGVNGGMLKRTMPQQVPINYIQVESVDEYLEKAVKNGGREMVGKTEVSGVGYIAWIADPEGNLMGLLQPSKSSTVTRSWTNSRLTFQA
jgi:predicted enzyme related to lactoylglutathione lyase